ncbi:MAG: hypothetical protein AB7N76_24595 [Planctomycetota bacterium]
MDAARGKATGHLRRLLGAAALTLLAAAWVPEPRVRPVGKLAPPPEGESNIHARDYVGPEACGECHTENYQRWRAHPHSRMNADAGPDTVLGDFSGQSLDYAGSRVRFEREGAAYFMTLEGPVTLEGPGPRRRYRVTRTVGSRYTQMYVGVLVEGPEPPGDPAYRTEGKLPFGWWLRRRAWFPEPYFDSDCPPEYRPDGRPSLPADQAHRTGWEDNCIYCHNTYPYEERLRARAGTEGFPAADLSLDPRAGADRRPGLGPGELVTLGISCESCHFGGREHAQDGARIRFLPQSPALRFPRGERIGDARRDPYAINGICAQCHFSRGVSPYPDGSGTWNSREAVDLLGGGCASQLKCTDCHDPHQAGPPDGAPTQPAHEQACLRCHPSLREARAREDHAQHAPGTVGCLDCHMPRVVQGLEVVVRTHRISVPGDPRMLAAGMPNACNLCHLDRSLRWTASALQVGWGRKVGLEESWARAYPGGLDAPVGQAWLASREPIVRLVASDAWSRSPRAAQESPRLIRALEDPQAVNRMFALFALERALGRPLSVADYDPIAPPARRREQVARLLLAARR